MSVLVHAGAWRRLQTAVLLSVVLCGCWIAQPGLASGARFQRGDVFAALSAGVQEYSPTGALVQTIRGSLGQGSLCFDPSGKHLILPGVGLFDSSGNLLQSSWAADPGGRCVADGFGHVYVGVQQPDRSGTITKYSITGRVLQTFNIPSKLGDGLAIDVAPDECTIYYGSWVGAFGITGELNACTNTFEPSVFGSPPTDDLRVLPNWQVLVTDDPDAFLIDTSGSQVRQYIPGGGSSGETNGNSLRSLSLDPDGTSFWLCCTSTFSSPDSGSQIFHFDIDSGQLLASWPLASYTPINIYSPPLMGDGDVEGIVDSDFPGTAEAFRMTTGYTGQVSGLHLYVDSSSTATSVDVGIYSAKSGDPNTLLTQGTITGLQAGSWNYVDLPAVSVTAGQRYWIALLAPQGAGQIRFRDRGPGGSISENSAQTNLTALPSTWSPGTTWMSGPLSAYGS